GRRGEGPQAHHHAWDTVRVHGNRDLLPDHQLRGDRAPRSAYVLHVWRHAGPGKPLDYARTTRVGPGVDSCFSGGDQLKSGGTKRVFECLEPDLVCDGTYRPASAPV